MTLPASSATSPYYQISASKDSLKANYTYILYTVILLYILLAYKVNKQLPQWTSLPYHCGEQPYTDYSAQRPYKIRCRGIMAETDRRTPDRYIDPM